MRVLGERELNRALLARQSLLERRRGPLPAAVERMGGVQAQYAPSIYVGLWSRVAGLERGQVTRALERRTLVQATLLRNTIHVVSPGDYWQFADATRDSRRAQWLQARAKLGPDRRAVLAAAKRMRRVLEKGPASRAELMPLAGGDSALFNGATHLARRGPRPARGHLGPPARGRVRARRRLDRARADRAPAPSHRRALPGGLRPGLGGRHRELVRDPARRAEAAAREPRAAPLPRRAGHAPARPAAAPAAGPETKAPVRFLPVWDAVLLVHARRTGILPERFRPKVFSTKTPQSVHTFTVDGMVAGTWREEKGRIRAKPFEPLPRAARRELDEEASRLERFVAG